MKRLFRFLFFVFSFLGAMTFTFVIPLFVLVNACLFCSSFLSERRISIVGPALLTLCTMLWSFVIWPRIDENYRRRLRRAWLLRPIMLVAFLGYLALWFYISQGRFPGVVVEQDLLAGVVLISPSLVYGLCWLAAKSWVRLKTGVRIFEPRSKRNLLLVAVALPGLVLVGSVTNGAYRAHACLETSMLEIRYLTSRESLRNSIHRCSRSNARVWHDSFLSLHSIGNEESVPLFLEALWWEPRSGGWSPHTVHALVATTNQEAGTTFEEWSAWYDKNRDRSQREWFTEGFRHKGVELSDAGSPQDVRTLLRLLGASPQPSARGLSLEVELLQVNNALRLLNMCKSRSITRALDQVVDGGTLEERRGASVYAQRDCLGLFGFCLWADLDLDLLEQLAQDPDDSVRLWADRGINSEALRRRNDQDDCIAPEILRSKLARPESALDAAGLSVIRAGERCANVSTEVRAVIENSELSGFEILGTLQGSDISRGVVALLVLAPEDGSCRSYPQRGQVAIVGYSQTSGELLWRHQLGFQGWRESHVMRHHDALIVSAADQVAALRTESGEFLWSRGLAGRVQVDGDRLAFRPEYGPDVFLDPESGSILPPSPCRE